MVEIWFQTRLERLLVSDVPRFAAVHRIGMFPKNNVHPFLTLGDEIIIHVTGDVPRLLTRIFRLMVGIWFQPRREDFYRVSFIEINKRDKIPHPTK